METLATLRGFKPLAFIPDHGLLLARGYTLFTADFDFKNLSMAAKVPTKFWMRVAARIRPLARLLRLGIRYGVQIAPGQFIIAERRRLWRLDLDHGTVELEHTITKGARPLSINIIQSIAGFNDCACFGDYAENLEKEPVRIWVRTKSETWKVAYTFPAGAIEHIHALVPDPWRDCVWILAGDFGDAASIWCARRNFTDITPVLQGDQIYRACWMRVTQDHLYYATDTQMTANSVRELILSETPKDGAKSVSLASTSGSSIYASHLGASAVFSTAVEPEAPNGNFFHDYFSYTLGPGIQSARSDLVIGNPESGFEVWMQWKKDPWPWRLFEYGSINFPTGTNPTSYVYAYFTGLSGVDNCAKILRK